MTASGPFAMGPALAGMASARRAAPRSNFAPVAAPRGEAGVAARLGAGLTQTMAPSLDREARGKGKGKKEEDAEGQGVEEAEVYSDPDEGVEIVDMENVRQMDWMAPESLRKEKEADRKKKKKEVAVKKEEGAAGDLLRKGAHTHT